MNIKLVLLLIIVCATVFSVWFFFIRQPDTVAVPNKPIESEWADLYSIQNDIDLKALQAATKATYADFVKTKTGVSGWQTFSKDAKQVPVTVGLSALGVNIPDSMNSILNTADWGIHSCPSTTGKPKLVLRLLFALGTQGELISYSGKQELFKKWEQTMLPDVQAVIFPQPSYPNNMTVVEGFADNNSKDVLGIRQTSVAQGANVVSEFGYVTVSDYVLIGSDINCMNNIGAEILGMVP